MNTRTLKSNALLLLTAAIWGFAFVAQRVGMDHVGPFTYNGVRFALGSLPLIPLMMITRNKSKKTLAAPSGSSFKALLWGGLLAGLAIFAGASLQQVGLVYTTAGKAGFITGLYVILVPLMGLFWKQRPDAGTWFGAALAAVGLYYLSVTEQFTIEFGDLLVLIGAFAWAGHVLLIGWLTRRLDPIRIAFIQFVVCSILSMIIAVIYEEISWAGIRAAAVPILYGGLASVGIAYTIQVVAQKNAKPSHAAIILSMESPFAALGGWIILNEIMSQRSLLGCMMMLAGMLISQLYPYFFRVRSKTPRRFPDPY